MVTGRPHRRREGCRKGGWPKKGSKALTHSRYYWSKAGRTPAGLWRPGQAQRQGRGRQAVTLLLGPKGLCSWAPREGS